MNIAIALVLFPGLFFTLLLGYAYEAVLERRPRIGPLRLPAFGPEALCGIVSLLLASFAVALLPWPFHPAAGSPWLGNPLPIVLAAEGAFLLPLVPGMLSQDAITNRSTIREAQISIAGRAIIWLALGSLLWGDPVWTVRSLPGYLLLVIAALLALPAAISYGPWSADHTLSSSSAEHGLDSATTNLMRFARSTRGAAILVLVALVAVPRTPAQPLIGLAIGIGLLLIAVVVLRRIRATLPRFALPQALSWCWWRALPVAGAGLVYLAVFGH